MEVGKTQFKKLYSLLRGRLLGNAAYAYWGQYPNFGDQLTPLLLRHYGFTPVFSHYAPRYKFIPPAGLISVGTLLQATPATYRGIVLGSGCGNSEKRSFPQAKILALRGKLTQECLSLEGDVILGDPGLLVKYLFPVETEKKYQLGIVPHFVDKQHEIIRTWQEKFGDEAVVIDVQQAPEKVIGKIRECETVVSSSLHGLVVADAFHIPNGCFMIRENRVDCEDDLELDFKYRDYYSAFNREWNFWNATGNEEREFLFSRLHRDFAAMDEQAKKLDVLFSGLRKELTILEG